MNEAVELVNGRSEFSVGLFLSLLEGHLTSLLGFFLTNLVLFGQLRVFNQLLVVINDIELLELNGAVIQLVRFLVVVFAMMFLHLDELVDTTHFDTVTLVVGRAIGFVKQAIECIEFGLKSSFLSILNIRDNKGVIIYVRLAYSGHVGN